MQLDTEKLLRLESAARDAHVLLTAADERVRDARGELNRKKMILLDQWKSLPRCVHFCLLVEEHGWSEDRLTRLEDFSRYEHGDSFLRSVREVEALQAELDRLDADYQRKQSHWHKLAAPLPSLRDFAAQYGIRSEKPHAVVHGADRPAGPSIFGGAA